MMNAKLSNCGDHGKAFQFVELAKICQFCRSHDVHKKFTALVLVRTLD